jgi:hypothetical protein
VFLCMQNDACLSNARCGVTRAVLFNQTLIWQ